MPLLTNTCPPCQRAGKQPEDIMNIDFTTILDAIDQYVFCKDKQGVYVYGNESFARIAGVHSKAAIIGKTDYDLPWKSQADLYRLNDQEVLDGKPLIRAEQMQPRADGTSSRIMITKVPYRSASGEIIGVLGNFFDCQQYLILETKGVFDKGKHRLYLEFVPEWLSAAEVRVCFYLIHGFSAARISEKIGSSISTVRFHIENIKNKMRCKNKNEITEVAMRTGIAWKIFSLQHVSDPSSEQ